MIFSSRYKNFAHKNEYCCKIEQLQDLFNIFVNNYNTLLLFKTMKMKHNLNPAVLCAKPNPR